MNFQRILLVRTGGLGDIILALPALRAIRSRFPSADITLAASSEAANIICNTGVCDRLVSFSRSPQHFGGFLTSSRCRQLMWMAGLHRAHFDAVAVLQPQLGIAGSLRSRLLVSLARPRESFGRNTDGRGRFFRRSVCEQLRSDWHEVDRAMAVAVLMGVEDTGERDISVRCDSKDEAKVESLICEFGVAPDQPIIAINPGSLRPCNRWPSDRFARAASKLQNMTGAAIAVLGTKAEKPLQDKVVDSIHGHVLPLAGRTTLGELAAVLSRASLLITNDTGTMHLAAAVGTPLVAVFSASDPGRVRPYAPEQRARVVSNHICGRTFCTSEQCMLNIGVDQVIEAGWELLQCVPTYQSASKKDDT